MSKTKYEYYKDKQVESLMLNILEKKKAVKPIFDLELGYRYPKVEKTIDMEAAKTIDFLENMVEIEILDKQIYDMELRCPKCNSPNVSVNYVCPKCTSPTIRKTIMIEHYECGYIGTVINFGEPLLCPNCGKNIKDNYRNAGSIYECSTCNQQIETPYINHWCRKCDLKFSFETALYQPRYAYLPTSLTTKEIDQGILYLSQVVRMFEEQGLTRDADSKAIGQSGVEHIFDAALTGFGSKFYIDVHFSLDPMSEVDLLKTFGKIRDVQIERENIEIFTLVIPGLDYGAEILARSYYSRAYLIEGENPSKVLSKLKTILLEKISTLTIKKPGPIGSLEARVQKSVERVQKSVKKVEKKIKKSKKGKKGKKKSIKGKKGKKKGTNEKEGDKYLALGVLTDEALKPFDS